MKLIDNRSWGKPVRTYSIAGAVERACDGFDNDPESDASADVRRTVDNVAEMLGRLIETLHENGKLNDQEVLDLIGSHRFLEAEPET